MKSEKYLGVTVKEESSKRVWAYFGKHPCEVKFELSHHDDGKSWLSITKPFNSVFLNEKEIEFLVKFIQKYQYHE